MGEVLTVFLFSALSCVAWIVYGIAIIDSDRPNSHSTGTLVSCMASLTLVLVYAIVAN
jgi:hypothetical protein